VASSTNPSRLRIGRLAGNASTWRYRALGQMIGLMSKIREIAKGETHKAAPALLELRPNA
jgi:hypothetical protein